MNVIIVMTRGQGLGMQADQLRYYDLNTYLREQFGCRVQKISVDTGLTCPNRDGTIGRGGCIYCNQKGSGTGAYARGVSVSQQIRAGKAFLSRRYRAKKFIAYFQSFSNTYGPFDRLKNLYEQALAIENVVGLSIGTRPDCVDEPILELLQGYADNYLVWIEYGLQSANDSTLAFRGFVFTVEGNENFSNTSSRCGFYVHFFQLCAAAMRSLCCKTSGCASTCNGSLSG